MVGHETAPGKNEFSAIGARKEANRLFLKEQDLVGALELYNKSLCLSPVGSENIGICYANRSAVFFESGFYQFCLDNIELALENNYPEQLKPKLEARRLKCLELMKNPKKSDEIKLPIQLSYPANKKNPLVIDGIELKTSEEFGRHIRAKRDLYPGDVVIIDKPFFKSLDENFVYKFCNNCHETNLLNLFPCKNCITTMYCGSECEKEAWKRFHKFECNSVGLDLFPLPIRAALMTFTLFNDVEKLRNLIESISKNQTTAFDIPRKDEIETFKAVYTLETHRSERSLEENFTRSMILAQSWHFLQYQSALRALLKTSEDENLFLNTLFHFSLICTTNSHEIFSSKSNGNDRIGSALNPILSLVNHSCAANVCPFYVNQQFLLVVVRNIKTGDQLFDNYGPHHQSENLAQRQARLSTRFFKCKCEACEKNYPLLENSPVKSLSGFDKMQKVGEKLINFYDTRATFEYYKKCVKFFKKFGDYYPCLELLIVQSNLIRCMRILFEPTPLEVQFKSSKK
ncbi:SET and MYND domain-containing protein 4-like [Culicoides brevitarsis]|uniref:SET and MYND domain-containing protein 4-like n=1 Tax=Culicoides brevitarsis TaxID=469753 RepID=UPI00307B7DC5